MEKTTAMNRLEKVMALLNEVDKEVTLLLQEQTKVDFEYSQAMMERNDMEHLVEHLDTEGLSGEDALLIVKETNRIRNERREAKMFKELMERQTKTLTQIQAFSKQFRNETLKRASSMNTNYFFRTVEIAELYKSIKQKNLPIRQNVMMTEHLYSDEADKIVQKLTKGRSLTGGKELSNDNLHYITKESNGMWVLKSNDKKVMQDKSFGKIIHLLALHDITSVAMGKKLSGNIKAVVMNQTGENKERMNSWYKRAIEYWQKQKTLI